MKASDYIVSYLAQNGVDVVFGYIGGMITHLVDSLGKSDEVRFVQTYHEQTASMAAEGYALESGKIGVSIATSGPGATNMATGIADAYFGNIPVLYITGQVNTYEYKYDKPIRQQGFQETDVVSIVKPITKYAVMVDKPENLCFELEKAIHIATTGRKGPVLIDLPMNISRADINPEQMRHYEPETPQKSQIDISLLADALSKAKYPMVLVGGGCIDAREEVDAFVRKYNLPVVVSLMGKGIVDETYENYLGMIGSYGNRCANLSFAKVDLLIALGSRLDTRQTGAKIDGFVPNGKIIHVDIDDNELKCHRILNRILFNTDVSAFLTQVLQADMAFSTSLGWIEWLQQIKQKYSQEQEVARFVSNKAPYMVMQELNKITKQGDIITADIGQNQMWAAQTIAMKPNQRFVTSGGLAPMGFSLPVAIGMAFANPSKAIYCITGDGGLHMAVQSLLLISQYKLNIKVIVMNNSVLGMITQFQHLYFDSRMYATTQQGGYILPSLEDIAKAYNLPYYQVDGSCPCFKQELQKGGCIVDCLIGESTVVSPKLEYDKPIYNMLPLLDDGEIKFLCSQLDGNEDCL